MPTTYRKVIQITINKCIDRNNLDEILSSCHYSSVSPLPMHKMGKEPRALFSQSQSESILSTERIKNH